MKALVYTGSKSAEVLGVPEPLQKEGAVKVIKVNATEEMHYIDSFSKVEGVIERVTAIREACGKAFGVAEDFYDRAHKSMAKVLL